MADVGKPCHLALILCSPEEVCARCEATAAEHPEYRKHHKLPPLDAARLTADTEIRTIFSGPGAPHYVHFKAGEGTTVTPKDQRTEHTLYHDDGAKLRWSLLPWDAVRSLRGLEDTEDEADALDSLGESLDTTSGDYSEANVLAGRSLDYLLPEGDIRPAWHTLEDLPWDALRQVVQVLEYGAKKYEAHSWLKLQNGKARYLESAWRHWVALCRGETHDPESGLHHAAHLACNALFVKALDLRGIGD